MIFHTPSYKCIIALVQLHLSSGLEVYIVNDYGAWNVGRGYRVMGCVLEELSRTNTRFHTQAALDRLSNSLSDLFLLMTMKYFRGL